MAHERLPSSSSSSSPLHLGGSSSFAFLSTFLSAFLLLSLPTLMTFPARAFGAPSSHLVHSLPGQPPVNFRQYAGYINVDQKAGRYLFYYFVEASTANMSSTQLPLALWLNGGPGCSSVGGGAFTELGPFHPNTKGDGLLLNPYSWNKASNILFLETPSGVGFSYSNTNNDNNSDDSKVATENLAFLLAWFKAFPEFQASELFLTGESYAGHYIPQLADLILKYNAEGYEFKFNLKGIAIGNPLLNYGLDTNATYSFLWSHGVISDQTYDGIRSSCDFSNGYPSEAGISRRSANDNNNNNNLNATTAQMQGCSHFLHKSAQEIGNINTFDVTLDICKPAMIKQQLRLQRLMSVPQPEADHVDVCTDDEVVIYLNRPAVQSALHANTTGLPYRWEACSTMLNYLFEDQLQDMLPLLGGLLQKGLRVWIYSGDQDSVVPLTGTRTQIDLMVDKLSLLTTIPYSAWYAEGQVGGWTYAFGNLTYATVRGAAHMVPFAQPFRALVLFKAFILGTSLPSS